ncbi:MAG: TetR family transcriptional regulator C-terminal domain-containing protein, partial [Gemmatimonadota bacterium]
GRYEDARQAYEAALAQYPGDALFHRNLGDVLGRLGRDDDARAAYGVAASLLEQQLRDIDALGRLDEVRAAVERARASSPSPLAAARRVLEAFADLAATPAEMANHLAFLQMDLTDPDFHRLTRRQAQEQERLLRQLLLDAMDIGELRCGDAGALARTLLTVTNGSLLRWAIMRKGSARRWLRNDLDAVLQPWLPALARRRGA